MIKVARFYTYLTIEVILGNPEKAYLCKGRLQSFEVKKEYILYSVQILPRFVRHLETPMLNSAQAARIKTLKRLESLDFAAVERSDKGQPLVQVHSLLNSPTFYSINKKKKQNKTKKKL